MSELIPYLIYLAAVGVLAAAAANPAGRRQVGAIAAVVSAWAFQTLYAVAPTIAVTFAKGMLTTFEQNKDLWAQVVSIFVEELTGQPADPDTLAAIIGGGGLGAAAPAVGAPLIQAVLQLLGGSDTMTPDSAEKNLTALLGITTALSLQGWYTATAGELVSLGHFHSAADLPDAVERGLGLQRLGRLAWRPYVQHAIVAPANVALNMKYRFTQLPYAEAVRAWHRGYYTADQLEAAAAAQGVSQDNRDLLANLAERELALEQVWKMMRYQGLSSDDATALLRKQGWTADQIPVLLNLLETEQEQKILEELASTTRKLYRVGEVDQDTYGSLLAQAHYTQPEIARAQQADQLALREEKRLTTAELGQLAAGAHITPQDYLARMTTLGYSTEDASMLLALHTKQLSPAQVFQAKVEGQLTDAQAIEKLQGLGWSADDATVLLHLRGKRLSLGQVFSALQHQLITADVARQDLEQLGYPDDVIDVMLAVHQKTLAAGDVQTLYLRGALTEQDALARLIQAGYSQADAQALLELRIRRLSEAQVLGAYGDDLISRQTAAQDLVRMGMTAADVETVLRVFDVKQAAKAAKAKLSQGTPTGRPGGLLPLP